MSTAPGLAAVEREWRRFTPAERLARFSVYLGIVAAIVASLQSIEIIPEFLYDAPEQIGDMLRRMWPVAWDHYPEGIHAALLDSLHIATLGRLAAVVMAVPVAFLAARNVTPVPWLNYLAKLILVSSRSVNTLIWALFFVAVFGPGALAGTMAIAFHSIGFTGKLLGEALEESNRGTIEALEATGAPRFAVLPQVFSRLVGFVSYETDANLRNSTMVGIVGAGGIGGTLFAAFQRFDYDFVCTIVLTIIALIMAGEILTVRVKRIFRA